jgi:hypothetical protein
LVTQPYDFSIASLIEDIDSDRLLLELEYQRSYVWDDAKASRLIESLWREVLALVRRAIAPSGPGAGPPLGGSSDLLERSTWRPLRQPRGRDVLRPFAIEGGGVAIPIRGHILTATKP